MGQNQLGVEETCLKCRFLGLSPHIFDCPGLVRGPGEMREGAQISHSTDHVCNVHTIRASNKRDAREVGKVGGPGQGAWKSRPQSEGMGPRLKHQDEPWIKGVGSSVPSARNSRKKECRWNAGGGWRPGHGAGHLSADKAALGLLYHHCPSCEYTRQRSMCLFLIESEDCCAQERG